MNGLVTDLQMFALKSLQIPLPGRHPPSLFLSNGFDTPRYSCVPFKLMPVLNFHFCFIWTSPSCYCAENVGFYVSNLPWFIIIIIIQLHSSFIWSVHRILLLYSLQRTNENIRMVQFLSKVASCKNGLFRLPPKDLAWTKPWLGRNLYIYILTLIYVDFQSMHVQEDITWEPRSLYQQMWCMRKARIGYKGDAMMW